MLGAEPGATVFLDMAELGAFGDATVLSIEPCPEIVGGSGNVVTGRFIHAAGETINVHIDGRTDRLHAEPPVLVG